MAEKRIFFYNPLSFFNIGSFFNSVTSIPWWCLQFLKIHHYFFLANANVLFREGVLKCWQLLIWSVKNHWKSIEVCNNKKEDYKNTTLNTTQDFSLTFNFDIRLFPDLSILVYYQILLQGISSQTDISNLALLRI